jgi:hypothetical protein
LVQICNWFTNARRRRIPASQRITQKELSKNRNPNGTFAGATRKRSRSPTTDDQSSSSSSANANTAAISDCPSSPVSAPPQESPKRIKANFRLPPPLPAASATSARSAAVTTTAAAAAAPFSHEQSLPLFPFPAQLPQFLPPPPRVSSPLMFFCMPEAHVLLSFFDDDPINRLFLVESSLACDRDSFSAVASHSSRVDPMLLDEEKPRYSTAASFM